MSKFLSAVSVSPRPRRAITRRPAAIRGPRVIAIDIGNTNIVIGLVVGRTLTHEWRLATQTIRTADEYGASIRTLLQEVDAPPPSEAIVSSVVPNLTPAFVHLLDRYLGLTPAIVSHTSPFGLTIGYPHPDEIGADRLVNASAAYHAFGGPLIIVDFGTATTFCAVTADGTYLGGVIAPGVTISADALTARAAKLSKVELARPRTIIGRDTASSMQSGIIQGHACMVDGIVRLMQEEMGDRCRVVATGGLSSLIAGASQSIDTVRPNLTLEGLALLAEHLRDRSFASGTSKRASAGRPRTRRPQ